MTFGNRLVYLRRQNHYTQERLAEVLGVSRQAISKWESDAAFPKTEQLIRLSELFGCTVDSLLKDDAQNAPPKSKPASETFYLFRRIFRDRKSEKEIFGMPLWHIGKRARGFIAIGVEARGVIAIGACARGILSLGLVSLGVLAFGVLSLGLLALGAFALGLFALGSICAGFVSAGAISLGVVSFGAIAVGDFSAGALAIGKYAAIGDHARGGIALGKSFADGSVWQVTGDWTKQDIAALREWLDASFPTFLHLKWAKDIFKLVLR